MNTRESLDKFNPKSNVGILFGYSNTSKAYRVYNKRALVVEESMHVTFDESNPPSMKKVVVNNDADDNAPCKNQEERQEEQTNSKMKDIFKHSLKNESTFLLTLRT